MVTKGLGIERRNKYDYYLIVLISLLVFGEIGGSLQPIRVVSILLVPYVAIKFLTIELTVTQRKVFHFFAVWFIYSIFSLFWTSNLEEAYQELIYYFVHFTLFFLIVFWSQKANDPLQSIIYGWCLFFILTVPVALNEILFDQHLAASTFNSDLVINLGGDYIVQKKFAAVTFGNYNTYATILTFTLPFLFSLLIISQKAKSYFTGWLLVGTCIFILLVNASRGGIICIIIIASVFFYYHRKKTFKGNRQLNIIIFLVLAVVIYSFSSVIFEQLSYRFISGSSLVEDTGRFHLYRNAWELLDESSHFGTGIGSMISSMESISRGGIAATHNLFIEILMQFGWVVFLLFVVFLIRIYFKTTETNLIPVKFIVFSILFSMIPAGLINSGYLLMPAFWVLLASIFVVGASERLNWIYNK